MFTYPDEREFKRLQARISYRLEKYPATQSHPDKFARIVIDVELGLALMSRLNLEDEPITTVWVLLHDLPLRFEEDHFIAQEQRRALANARHLLSSYAGSFAWEAALRDYVNNVPREWRMYDFNAGTLEAQLLSECRINDNQFQDREAFYQNCLTSVLDFKRRNLQYAVPNTDYQFRAEMPDADTRNVTVSIPSRYFPEGNLEQTETYADLFSPRERMSIRISINDLRRVAEWLDDREVQLGIERTKTWVERLDDVCLQIITGEEALEEAAFLDLEGMFHLAGMVGSGKSTLMILIAVFFVKCAHDPAAFQNPFQGKQAPRITLVVGDSATSIQLADQFNRWFCDSPEDNNPVAVPLLGQSTRHTHLKQLHQSRDYQQAGERIHWGDLFEYID